MSWGPSEPRTDARVDGSRWLDSGAMKAFSILLVSLLGIESFYNKQQK